MSPDERVMPAQTFGLGFHRNEFAQIWAGIALMTIAFALAYVGGGSNAMLYFYLGGGQLLVLILAGSFLAVLTAFFLHELAHKAVAQRYGAVAEFRHSPVGLLAGLVTAAAGVMIAVPGAVVITGAVTKKQQLRISAAGPVTNLACAAGFIALSLALGTGPGRFREPMAIIIGSIAFVNVLLAGFNLPPVPAIDIHRTVKGKFPVNVVMPASDGWLIWTSGKAGYIACVATTLGLGLGGHFLGVF